MQPGVCFEAETNVLTGEMLVFLVETNVSRRQKRFVFQVETNVLVLSKLGTGSSGKRKQMFPPKTNDSLAKTLVSGLETNLFWKR